MCFRKNVNNVRLAIKPSCEGLENRQVPAGSMGFTGGSGGDRFVIDFDGTDVQVFRQLDYLMPGSNGDTTSVPVDCEIVIEAGGGPDLFQINRTDARMRVTVIGGEGLDSAENISSARTWTITGMDATTLGPATFTSVERLVGSQTLTNFSHGDLFRIMPGGSISDFINGRDLPLSTLDYSAWTQSVSVDLAAGTASGLRQGLAGGVVNVRCLVGGAGNDVLLGKSGSNVIRGGTGNDQISGRGGEDLLLGGGGSDVLDGGGNDDILVGDRTVYDTVTPANDQALLSIVNTWSRVDAYEADVAALRARYLNSTTVFGDRAQDTMTGGGGTKSRDWFLTVLGTPFTWADLMPDRDPATEWVN